MKLELIKAVIVLPGTALVFVPGAILWLAVESGAAPAPAGPLLARFWYAVVPGTFGFALAFWKTRLFLTAGRGTPAPWAPPERLVVRGPYRHVRNPMITGVLLMLGAESLFFGSWHLTGWTLVFFAGNALYFPLVEERALEKRFGDDYRLYKANVPRWIPRWRAWEGIDR